MECKSECACTGLNPESRVLCMHWLLVALVLLAECTAPVRRILPILKQSAAESALRSLSCRGKMARTPSESSGDAAQEQQQTYAVPLIFLSHSGKQKGFVERLKDHLMNAGHYAFFDQHTIPHGVPFPKYIEQAASQCHLGVVILSNDFMISKWPMMELDILFRNSFAQVMPVFFELSPRDIKSPTKLCAWKNEWEAMASKDKALDISGWETAVKSLAFQKGEVYRTEASQGGYIKKIVAAICRRYPPPLTYDMSYAKGQQRLIQEVETQFKNASLACKSSDAPIIGMYGVSGQGKTTLCQLMANVYKAVYLGKSEVLVFPSHKNEGLIVKDCIRVLKALIGADQTLLDGLNNFDKVVQLMKEQMKSHTVFLAIDNVWEHSQDQALRILKVGFGPGSKVLVTSRSQALLMELLEGCNEVCVRPVPSVNEKEALETFQASFGSDISLASGKSTLDRVVSLCRFNGCYHPLTLKALGRRLKRMGGLSDASAMEQNLSQILSELQRFGIDLQRLGIDDLIKSNYIDMPPIVQRLFLDVVITFRRTGSFDNMVRGKTLFGEMKGEKMRFEETLHEEMREWLSILYELEYGDIDEKLQQLALDGLLQFEGEGMEKRVMVHDMYEALAEHEAAASSRFLLGGTRDMGAVQWEQLERVVLDDKTGEMVELQDCPKLQLLYASGYTFSKGLRLEGMKALRVLIVENCIGNLTGLKVVPKLAVLHLKVPDYAKDDDDEATIQPAAWTGLRALRDLHSCHVLRSLVLHGECIFLRAEDNVNYFPPLANLRTISLTGYAGLKELPDLSISIDLRVLYISKCKALEQIRGLPFNLKSIKFDKCAGLLRIPDLRGLVQLQSLRVLGCGALKEIPDLPPNLVSILLYESVGLQRIPDLSRVSKLRSLGVVRCRSLEEILGLPSNLKSIVLNGCAGLQKIPDLRGMLQLQSLRVQGCGCVKEMWGLPSDLGNIELHECAGLQILDLSRVARLQSLHITRCGSLEGIWGLPSNLKSIELEGCARLQRIPDLSGLVQLQSLRVQKCESLEEIPDVPPNLEGMEIFECTRLQRIPDLSRSGHLCRLRLM